MGFFKKVKKAVRKVYNATSDSHSGFGRKFGKYAFPFNGQYFVRDGFRSFQKRIAGKSSAVDVSAGLPSSSFVPGTGFRRYV